MIYTELIRMKIGLNKLSIAILLCAIVASIFIYYQRYKEAQTYKFKKVSNEVHQYRININSAKLKELDNLPGIGPSMAQRIIDHRNQNGPFQSLDEITKVKGIGAKSFEKIKGFIST